MLQIDILTLFPEMFVGPFNNSILKRAQDAGLVEIATTNLRDFANNKHRTVDDSPYGGGAGMVLRPQPVFEGVESILAQRGRTRDNGQTRIMLMTPQGQTFSQQKAQELASNDYLLMICGHYEGIDERIRQELVTDEISIGDYVLTGGELAAMVVTDAVVRLLPGVITADSIVEESFAAGLLEYPHYTRPAEYRGMAVPEVLISGNHGLIRKWRREAALRRTLERRPDLLTQITLDAKERAFLQKLTDEPCK